MSYDLKDVDVPRVSGSALKLAATLLEQRLSGWALKRKILKDMGFARFSQSEPQTAPTFVPTYPIPQAEQAPTSLDLETIAQNGPIQSDASFRFWSISDYARAYRNKSITPQAVAERIIEACNTSNQASPPLRAITSLNSAELMQQAQESSNRFKTNSARGWLDGVPIAIKDELDQKGHPTTVGTAFLGAQTAQIDATVVARLREAGALLIGKTNMHEVGIGVTGMNPHLGHARNPYNPQYITGGSSSGSAAAVASGLCPVAIGADGGGSIRIPAGLCGVVGLKATFGRISEHGAYPLCSSVAHIGPIAASVQDAALVYAVIAGSDPKDPLSQHQPPVHLENLNSMDLDGVRIGVFSDWFDHAAPPIVNACRKAIDSLVARGARVVEIEIPNLDLMRLAHGISILTEMSACLAPHYQAHPAQFGLDVRINLSIAKNFGAEHYVKAQQIRTEAMQTFNALFKEVDAIVTPTTATTAVPILPDAIPNGETNLSLMTQIMRYMFVGNLTGIPGLSVPVGYDSDDMPIGFQIMGRPFEEHLLLQLGQAVEADFNQRQPSVFYDILNH